MRLIPIKSETTQYGIKYTNKIKLDGINGKNKSANVIVVIQKDDKRSTFKIVTVFPDKKGD